MAPPVALAKTRRRRGARAAALAAGAAACALGALARLRAAAWLGPAGTAEHAVERRPLEGPGALEEGSARGLLHRRQAALGVGGALLGAEVAGAPARAELPAWANRAATGVKAPDKAEELAAVQAGGQGFGRLSALQFSKLSKAAAIVKSQNLKANDESDLWGTMIEYHPEWLEEPKVGARVYANSGNALYRLGKPKKALQDYSLAISTDPTCGRLYVYRGIVLEELNRTDEAFADYAKGTEVDPNCAVAWASKGTGLMARGNYPEAKEALLKGTELFNNKPTPSPDEARLDAALPWAGLPRGFFFCIVNLAVTEYEVGDTASAQKRIDNLNAVMKDKPLAAAKAASALMVLANKGGSSIGIVDFEAEKAWKQVEDIDYRWHKFSFASKSIQWGPKLADALSALRQNRFISA